MKTYWKGPFSSSPRPRKTPSVSKWMSTIISRIWLQMASASAEGDAVAAPSPPEPALRGCDVCKAAITWAHSLVPYNNTKVNSK